MRGQRKLDHLRLAQSLGDGPAKTGFDDIHFIHNCLPEINSREINTDAVFCGKKFSLPVLINAITGGIEEGKKVNRALARAARQMGIPMAVGSQAAALEARDVYSTYQVVREENPGGFFIANLSAGALLEEVLQAVEMIRADAIQLHLNIPQEVTMPPKEGDSFFRGYLENIRCIARTAPVPVIVKEVGFGIAREEAVRLLDTGIAALDVEGKGGTNFIRVEEERKDSQREEVFFKWGLSTAVSLVEVAHETAGKVDIIAGGGIRSGLDIARVLSLGASMAGIAAPLVRCFYQGGEEAVIKYLQALKKQLRKVMLMLGAGDVYQLREKPLVILGETGQWLERRGISLQNFAMRGLEKRTERTDV